MVVEGQSVPIPIRRWQWVWTLRRYEFQPGHMKEVLGLSGTLNSKQSSQLMGSFLVDVSSQLSGFALVDWDRDGALDLLIASEI